MTRYASLQKNKSNSLKSPARVISLLSAGKKEKHNHAPKHGKKSKDELPLFHNERIFKAKDHDPL
ncbi:hypothetical protein A4D02_23285 [Niastella koreensis]|uniref:Uncharacterized protein n=2 Tax=Niastella koreensis TaxID=354356 RepID=G8TBU4_NIAKG|nr:hypothetical protein [Niastella koreensis]AEV98226.1 hypothetical protein Niako_1868 [Niastella koreensis GR20-10]OQP53315.1 hypothetical protein A4D02_23285 [Niastella koreensis]